jgi:hypothetical protein
MSFWCPKIFKKLYVDMSIFRRSTSKRTAKGVRGESSDNDLNILRLIEVRPCEWLHVTFMNEVGFYQEFSHFIENTGLTNFLADECDQYHILTNSFVQNFYFLSKLESGSGLRGP